MASPARSTVSPGRTLARAAALALLAPAATLAVLLPAPALGASNAVRAKQAVDTQALLRSRLLWATIDVCNASDQPDTLGIRGSMPGDAQAHDTMYMRFRLQYMNTTSKHWT